MEGGGTTRSPSPLFVASPLFLLSRPTLRRSFFCLSALNFFFLLVACVCALPPGVVFFPSFSNPLFFSSCPPFVTHTRNYTHTRVRTC